MTSEDRAFARFLKVPMWKLWAGHCVLWLLAIAVLWITLNIETVSDIPVSRRGSALTAVEATALSVVFSSAGVWLLVLTKHVFTRDFPLQFKFTSLSLSLALLSIGSVTLWSAFKVYSLVGWRDISL
jgi:succinate-acetate transporter protein